VLYRNIQHSTMPTRTCSPPWRRAPRRCALRLALRRRTFAGQVTRSQPRARAPLRTAHANLARVLTLPGVGETGPNAHWPCWAIEWGRKATKELRLLNCYRIFVLASFSYTIHVYTLTIHIKFSGKKLDIQLNTLEQKWALPWVIKCLSAWVYYIVSVWVTSWPSTWISETESLSAKASVVVGQLVQERECHLHHKLKSGSFVL
jgi:hypothetical protein